MSRQPLPTRLGNYYPSTFQSIEREMDQMMDRFRRAYPTQTPDTFFQDEDLLVPAIDFAETDGTVEISADIPGVSEENLDVTVHGDIVVIKGKKSTDREEKDKNYHLVERSYGSFRRSLPLGFVPEDGAVEADFADGVLKLKIKRPEGAESTVQKVTIKKT